MWFNVLLPTYTKGQLVRFAQAVLLVIVHNAENHKKLLIFFFFFMV